jgi:uncharacterized protein
MSETLRARLRADLDAARRAREKLQLQVLTMTLAELKNREIELGRDATDEDVVEVVNRAIRKRREASAQMRAAGRTELADAEDAEAAVLTGYLPAQLDEAAVRALIREAIDGGAADMGAVMARVMPALKGRFDGREANRMVREELG